MPFCFFCIHLSKNAVINGQRNKVTTEAVAHCAVAISVYCAMDGSASATAAGVIAEFRAVVPIAAPNAFLSFFGSNRLFVKKKITAVAADTRPRIMPAAPAVMIVLTSVFAPMEIVMKNVTIG